MNLDFGKSLLRKQLKQRRLHMDPAQRIKESADICTAAQSYIEHLRITNGSSPLTLFSYLAYRDEPDTLPLLEYCWQQGDTVLVPRIDPDHQGIFHLYRICSITDVEPGAYGIPEPREALPAFPPERWQEIDLVIVPGLGYDLQGSRIGYGGGYYDRFMHKLTVSSTQRPLLGAFAFDTQIMSSVPMEPHDFRIDILFTASGYRYTEQQV
ncbi:5-formyltetrahydrofolate cyclo-ligase [Paenibacillus bovis]|uniref:5-formyltetrahydrofolate cyclo-ligase n=1 Tax=Paenibacillus bovis TaxID=1616788 RepID=A0A172ZES4_9BACL|nr:5-formyltetrahydrofolate cyclo-ligase [Paenibacillus bovis]ANF96003.1 5-formyltetrahydrofolate cyclo-ligase [Paenibacillus bovis]